MKINDIIKTKNDIDVLLNEYKQIMVYNNFAKTKLQKEEVLEKELNNIFRTNFSFEEWLNYIDVLVKNDKINKKENKRIENGAIKLNVNRKKANLDATRTNRIYNHYARLDILKEEIRSIIKSDVDHKPISFEKLKKGNINYVFFSDFHYQNQEQNKIIEKSFLKMYQECDNNICLILTGDIIQGCLRINDILNGNWNPIEQTINFCKTFLQFIDTKKIKKIIILPGNHDELRLSALKEYKGIDNPSITFLIKEFINAKYENLAEVKKEWKININDKEYLVYHGHQFKGKNAIKKYADYNRDKFIIHAHLHHYYLNDNIIGLPSLALQNEYEFSLGIAPNKPAFLVLKNGWHKLIEL